MRRLLLIPLLAICLCQPAGAQNYVRLFGGDNSQNPATPLSSTNPLATAEPSTTAANGTNMRVALTGSVQTITLTAPAYQIMLWTDPSSAVTYVGLPTGTPTSSYAGLSGGQGIVYGPVTTPISSFKILAASASGYANVIAH